MAGLYIHIPFCASRCIYCGFYSTTAVASQDRYTDALCREMQMQKDYLLKALNATPHMELSTIYLGGGTPSQLSGENLEKLFDTIYNKVYQDQLPVSATAEVTIECNPDDITPQFASILSSLPVNRVSMGVQTFSDERLKFLRRRHSAREVDQAIGRLRQAGIGNISIDLMFGFPQETMADWRIDLQQALSLEVEHISAYSLMYEEGTVLYRLQQEKRVRETDEETSLAMYNLLIDELTAHGFEHYEISNFARPGFRSRHNSSYWQAVSYLGLGASAHSYNGYSRQWNVADIRQYIEAIERGVLPAEIETLDADTQYNDRIATALRTREGIDLSVLEKPYQTYLEELAIPHIWRGHLVLKDGCLALSRSGIFISDSIMADLMKV
ncbi:radical SAM family heme chaperone HemW [Prevotella sp. oral taxon 475]|uniref:radical SAM family heme chaperone HemW n=1 Tax=Prevotella sp. oral taxon 475 TaxID=712471 RepID=UPI001BAB1533|nr:radical SAM family heme chaperone HemW [Prevotella sp. oral taxon 475]QUB47971.1 radical SAM family heme chaperone HemW [Prevotella sp. oral taxon 475]